MTDDEMLSKQQITSELRRLKDYYDGRANTVARRIAEIPELRYTNGYIALARCEGAANAVVKVAENLGIVLSVVEPTMIDETWPEQWKKLFEDIREGRIDMKIWDANSTTFTREASAPLTLESMEQTISKLEQLKDPQSRHETHVDEVPSGERILTIWRPSPHRLDGLELIAACVKRWDESAQIWRHVRDLSEEERRNLIDQAIKKANEGNGE